MSRRAEELKILERAKLKYGILVEEIQPIIRIPEFLEEILDKTPEPDLYMPRADAIIKFGGDEYIVEIGKKIRLEHIAKAMLYSMLYFAVYSKSLSPMVIGYEISSLMRIVCKTLGVEYLEV